jgi:aspartate aminotransferase
MNGSDRINFLTESQTLAVAKRVRELKAQGEDILSLTLGEPDFDTPEHIRNAAIQAINQGFTHYPPVAGIPELRQAVAEKFSKLNNLPYKAENILISTGAKQSLINAVMSLVNPGDEVIIPAPYWVSYVEMVKMAEATPVIIPTSIESGFKLKAEQLEAQITHKTRMLIYSSPSNPAGSMYSAEELESLVAVLEKHPGIFILSDEIYEFITYGKKHVSIGSFPSLTDRTITINGVSKAFAMTGWRIGFLGAPKWITDLCEKFQGQVTSGTCSIAQKAAVAAMTESLEPTYAMVREFHRRNDAGYALLSEIPGIKIIKPEGAFYFYPDIKGFLGKCTPQGKILNTVDDLCLYLLDEAKVAVVTGTAFGSETNIRLSFATSLNILEKSIERIRTALLALS